VARIHALGPTGVGAGFGAVSRMKRSSAATTAAASAGEAAGATICSLGRRLGTAAMIALVSAVRPRRTMPAMAVVRLREPLKRLADGRSEHAIEGGSVRELLRELERAHPAAKGWILDERGELRPHLNVFVNGLPSAADAHVEANDRIDVVPAISGG
jgi:sulfur-carrier protein